MLLSKQQQYVLKVLDDLGTIQQSQLTALVATKFCTRRPDIAEPLTSAMLRQLRYGNFPLHIEDDRISLPKARSDPLLIEAISVMLELSENAPLDFSAWHKSVVLRFSVGGKKISLFAVLSAEVFSDPLIPPPQISPTERVIFLQTGGDIPRVAIPNKCFLAVKQADGTHRFFETNKL